MQLILSIGIAILIVYMMTMWTNTNNYYETLENGTTGITGNNDCCNDILKNQLEITNMQINQLKTTVNNLQTSVINNQNKLQYYESQINELQTQLENSSKKTSS